MPDAALALRPGELRRIAEGLGREPTTVELHAFDAQWSEHCSYKSSRHLLKQLPTSSDNVVVGPGEDAGIVHLGVHDGERYSIVIAHESHNHPSQVVPFEGAATGVGGIVRDVLCMGAEVIGLADCLRFGNVDDPKSHQRYVAQQAVDGIAAYGNAIGVPNMAGDVLFDEGFDDNCLVNVIALGIVKENAIIHSSAPPASAGWDIVLVGKATDASGFGGASFSSVTLEEENEDANKSAVQVPDPFLKNVIMRATYRVFEYLRENRIEAALKDLGAGGIMGCTAELCAAGGFGALIDLDDVNVAVKDLPAEVLAVGETQERLCWILPGGATREVLRIYNEEFSLPEIARGARAVVIGAVQDEKRYVLRRGGEIVMDVPIDFLTNPISQPPSNGAVSVRDANESHEMRRAGRAAADGDLEAEVAAINMCSREPLYKQYDAVVRGATVLPRDHADAGVIAPIRNSRLGVALAVGASVFEAVRRVIAVGARPLALTDCLNFGNPGKRDHYAALAHAVETLARDARAVSLPFVSGNVSLYNEGRRGEAVPPSAVIACVGAIDDLQRVITMGFKRPKSPLYFVGSEDMPSESRRIAFMLEAIRCGFVQAAHAVANEGIPAAVARMAFASANEFGADIEIQHYDESGGAEKSANFGGWIIETNDGREFEYLARSQLAVGECMRIGMTTVADLEGRVDLAIGERTWDLDELYDAWRKPLEEIYA